MRELFYLDREFSLFSGEGVRMDNLVDGKYPMYRREITLALPRQRYLDFTVATVHSILPKKDAITPFTPEAGNFVDQRDFSLKERVEKYKEIGGVSIDREKAPSVLLVYSPEKDLSEEILSFASKLKLRLDFPESSFEASLNTSQLFFKDYYPLDIGHTFPKDGDVIRQNGFSICLPANLEQLKSIGALFTIR